ncbi:uncharacterized protein LOC131597230 [Vicia villosa]|uniref:uncharacterized protein LOC131597230 n=1 Tax=Vicia villosa TaxID=3911 RepID=UPI00273CE9CC|nr:uncharacterized protein LOC131597230 [Vicia villosa]
MKLTCSLRCPRPFSIPSVIPFLFFPSMDVADLFPEAVLQKSTEPNCKSKPQEQVKSKSFAAVLSENVCDIPLSQLPIPCLKGDRLAIAIPEDEYKLGVEACKHHLHGRIIWAKGSTPMTVSALRTKLLEMWTAIGKWGITSFGKGFFEFAFSSLEDIQRVRLVSAWTLPNGVLKLFPWTKDFVPSTLKQTSAQVWIRIHGLSQEYRRPKILFAIASSIGTPICIDSASSKSAFERHFGHFVRVLVDLDLTKECIDKILVERVGFSFFVDIEYEKVPEFCSYCLCIGHNVSTCKRMDSAKATEQTKQKKQDVKGKNVIDVVGTIETPVVLAAEVPNKENNSSQNVFEGETSTHLKDLIGEASNQANLEKAIIVIVMDTRIVNTLMPPLWLIQFLKHR